jgi:molybdopterin-guanine dinucleotide biosynthesis protein A
LPPIEQQIAGGDYKIDRFFPNVSVRRLGEPELRLHDPGLDSFRNVNTPDVWDAVLQELAVRASGGADRQGGKTRE